MERDSVHRVNGINKKPIPMTQIITDLINNQAKAEGQPEGIVFGDINMHTTINDLNFTPKKAVHIILPVIASLGLESKYGPHFELFWKWCPR